MSQQNRDYVPIDGEKYNKSPDGSMKLYSQALNAACEYSFYDYTDGSGKTHIGTNCTDTFEE